ncbi:Hypothetical predicted protein [Olea europaea subsp. europaea]|uniref:Uncharacterized protein n=1 Tax=Olea europaea subsp. europaea TaxID=158383 RepID=A0A8S0PMT5_OLEEU|nr:Hypothetical predicted protein [Olea europaea subsp. europaea]
MVLALISSFSLFDAQRPIPLLFAVDGGGAQGNGSSLTQQCRHVQRIVTATAGSKEQSRSPSTVASLGANLCPSDVA